MTSKSRRRPKPKSKPSRCPHCGKFAYPTEDTAAIAAARMGGHRVYWSETCHAWHTTSQPKRALR